MRSEQSGGRRKLMALAGTSLVLAACERLRAAPARSEEEGSQDEGKEQEVSVTEDLMREHGVIRRIIVVYRESALRLRSSLETVSSPAILEAAQLMRKFGEEYHERALEETYIFPHLKAKGGIFADEVDTLLKQHARGRELTDYIIANTQAPVSAAKAGELAKALEGFSRMYEEHTAREDTIIFPRWKSLFKPHQLEKMGDLFESIEKAHFGHDGFEDAVKRVQGIEELAGLDTNMFTASPPTM